MSVTMDQVTRQVDATTAAREAQAVGADYAPDYVMVDGVRFYAPTLAHTWFALRWHGCRTAGALPSYADYALVIVCSLLHDGDYVRNSMMPAIADVPGLVEQCYAELMAAGVTPAAADKVVLGVGRDLFGKRAEDAGDAQNPPPAPAFSHTGGRG